jgi:predicted AAA+ superfamily ATPase
MTTIYQREQVSLLHGRLQEPVRFLAIVAGPRQVGKTTLVRQVLNRFPKQQYTFLSIDLDGQEPMPGLPAFGEAGMEEVVGAPRDAAWLVRNWQKARAAARNSEMGHILVLDEIQKISRWSDTVKGLWDADRAEGLSLHVVLLGSSPLLMQKGMTESLAGRYELIRVTHWSFPEMHDAFGLELDDYVYFGGYPGSMQFVREELRWRNYVRDALVQPSIQNDILLMTRVDKPALLKSAFYLGCAKSGEIFSYNKMLGQLQDAGNATTLAHYLELLEQAGLLVGLQKYAGQRHRQKGSSPKLNVLNTALMAVESGYSREQAAADRTYWGRLVESAVGAHLYNTGSPDCRLYYWRESPHEVDFVVERGRRLLAIEVKSGNNFAKPIGLDLFTQNFPDTKTMLIGEGGVHLAEFLSYPASHWLD